MSPASLPYTVVLLLAELAVGSLAFLAVFDARRSVTRGYVKAGGIVVLPIAALALWAAWGLGEADDVAGYPLETEWLAVFRATFAAFIALTAAHLVASLRERWRAEVALAALASAAGVVALAALAAVVGGGGWVYAGVLASVLASAAVLGGALMAMMWGHWYLTEGRLPKEPLEQMSLVVLGALVLQAALVALALLAPVRPVTIDGELALAQNPALWLRIGVGLLFPIALAWLAWQAATIRGMMSATGLLYIALGAVLAGEVLARGLLFTTGVAV